MSCSKIDSKARMSSGILRWAGQIIVSQIIFGVILFLAAGRLNWAAGWAFFGINTLTQVLSAMVLISRQPEMLAERSRVGEGTKTWDRFLTPAIVIFTLAIIATAGLDVRFKWSAPMNGALWVLGLTLAFCCQMFVLWAMASNSFFATTVRIQDERGHRVVNGGPYRLVRHPGYLGSVLYTLLTPFALGSLWTFLPALLTIVLIMVRTGLEDRTLQAELPGYTEYAARVRFRLFPGVW